MDVSALHYLLSLHQLAGRYAERLCQLADGPRLSVSLACLKLAYRVVRYARDPREVTLRERLLASQLP